jgi:hypothetical protein
VNASHRLWHRVVVLRVRGGELMIKNKIVLASIHLLNRYRGFDVYYGTN